MVLLSASVTGPVEERTTSRAAGRSAGVGSSRSISWRSRVAAARPQATTSVCTEVSDGWRCAEISMSSKPVTDRSPRHRDTTGRGRATARPSPSGRWRRPRRWAAPRGRAGRAWPGRPTRRRSPPRRRHPRAVRRRQRLAPGVAARAAVHHLQRAGDVGDVAVSRDRRGARRRRGCRARRPPRAPTGARGAAHPGAGPIITAGSPSSSSSAGRSSSTSRSVTKTPSTRALLHQPAVRRHGRPARRPGAAARGRAATGHGLETGDEGGEERVGAQDLRRAGR